MRFSVGVFILAFAWLAFPTHAKAMLCISPEDDCKESVESSSPAPAYPSQNSKIELNPAAVPTQDGFGVEALGFKGGFAASVVKGTGRIGAGIALNNGEETFFGPPGFETDAEARQRHLDQTAYPSQNLTLASAFNVFDNKHDDLRHLSLDVGLSAQYNKISHELSPGVGVAAIAGPFTLGYSASNASSVVDSSTPGLPNQVLHYSTNTYSLGFYLGSFAFNYSLMNVYGASTDPFTIQLYTASLLLKRWIVTYSYRFENSSRTAFDQASQQMIYQPLKYQDFFGVQFAISKHILVGLFYNYFLLNEGSAGITVLF